MKIITTLLFVFVIISCATGKEKEYIGSTPAGPEVRSFLGIPQSDSIDFIRWKLFFLNNEYHLECNYGIGKPNTNGFMQGGKKLELNGIVKKEGNYYSLGNGSSVLRLAELNDDLLHPLDANSNFLIGNGGWSYTLNNTHAMGSTQFNLVARNSQIKDSLTLQGRSPCRVPGVIPEGQTCYKLKWLLVLYSDPAKKDAGTYLAKGTPWRKEDGRHGTWKVVTGKNGRIIYELNDTKGSETIHLLKLDENVFVFTNADGVLLVGDEDFSYTLNRR